ncbi:hypothetical protein LMG27174_05888 [Paraburkholderia rhynchosiae]|uniref:DUF3300 domain-containing protein n=1 Tax=Paraburkholderia rhynchosiae TaxID=487049 RepID=A0A6J5CAD8_9BURK|nr:hypothetical protein LMG27174_05888 [Paraburkholderia rhynchosiae]
MKRSTANPRGTLIALAILAGLPVMLDVTAPAAYAQTAAKISNQQLDSLTAPIALYPDALLAQVLMASTFPQDTEAAAAWSKANGNTKGDDAVKAVAAQPWDPSVQSLVAFPQVLATMASKPDWVAQLGNAFLAQPNDVMDSVQRLRKQAQQAGNLKTTGQQKVIVEQTTIQIVPVNPQVVYVPTYNPTVVYGAWPYPAYPPVYMPPPPGYAVASGLAAGLAFGAGIAITSALWSDVNWNNHSVNINVNRYNNINVNRRLDVNSNTTSWNRNTTFNRNTSANAGGVQRDAYRGRDMSTSRAQAQQTLQNRTGQNLGGTEPARARHPAWRYEHRQHSGERAKRESRQRTARRRQRTGRAAGHSARASEQAGASRRSQRSGCGRWRTTTRRRFGRGRRRARTRRWSRCSRRRTTTQRWSRCGRRRTTPLRPATLNDLREPLMNHIQTIGVRFANATALPFARRLAYTAIAMSASLFCAVSAHAQAVYPTPDAAVNAFVDALATNDHPAMQHVLGKDFNRFIPSKDVGEEDIYEFLGAWAAGHRIVDDAVPLHGRATRHLSVGTSGWTLPVPLVQAANGWRFDPASGSDEILTRRIGRNERAAMMTSLA